MWLHNDASTLAGTDLLRQPWTMGKTKCTLEQGGHGLVLITVLTLMQDANPE